MTDAKPIIVSYQDRHQADIDAFMQAIALEFNITIAPIGILPFQLDRHWVALCNEKAIGTIALCKMAHQKIALRKMFLDQKFRGGGVSKMLLDTLMDWAYENKISAIYLETMSIFKAAQKFYEKNGFEKIDNSSLPPDFFIVNSTGSVFYQKKLF